LTATREDLRWLHAAAALARRGRPLSRPNPSVGAILVRDGIVVGRGWTQPGGRPHAEAVALAQAGEAARGATLYVTLEPCAHESQRGRCCTDLLIEAGISRAVIGMIDPDARTAGDGIARLEAAGITTALAEDEACRASLKGYLSVRHKGRPHIALKLAVTADGYIARADGTSKWITGEEARAHVHAVRAENDAILVGGGTLRADSPRLDVRLEGLEERSPRRLVLTREVVAEDWEQIDDPALVHELEGVLHLLVEGGAGVAHAFLDAGLVDEILLYRSPTEFGTGLPAFADTGTGGVPHGWRLVESRQLGSDTLSIYEPG